MPQKVILDVDTGTDDAVAIVYRGLSRPPVRRDFAGREDHGSGSKEDTHGKEFPTWPRPLQERRPRHIGLRVPV